MRNPVLLVTFLFIIYYFGNLSLRYDMDIDPGTDVLLPKYEKNKEKCLILKPLIFNVCSY